MALTDDVTLPRDPSGQPSIGVIDDATQYLFGPKGDEAVRSMHVTLWRWDSSGLEWVKWDGKMDTVVSGDLIVAVDDLEALLSSAPVAANNPSYAVDYNADGTPNYVDMTVEGTTYRQSFTYTSGLLTGVSAWVEQ